MKTKINLKAGRLVANHNQTRGLRIRTSLKGGRLVGNHNETLA